MGIWEPFSFSRLPLELSILLYAIDRSHFCPYQNFLTLTLTPLPSPLPLESGGTSYKVGESFCRVKSANVQQIVTHIPCKSKFSSIVALLKMGVCSNCTALIERAGTSPLREWEASDSGGCGEARGSCLERWRGSCSPPPGGRRAQDLAGSQAPSTATEPRRIEPICKEWAGQLQPFSRAPPTGFLANHMQEASPRGVCPQSDPTQAQ